MTVDKTPDTAIIASLLQEWVRAVESGDAGQVIRLYDDEAILLPTVSNQIRRNHREIEDYFTDFLALAPKGSIGEENIRLFGEIAINSGLYTFTFPDKRSTQARFTFVYRFNGQRWMIIEHHSSYIPNQSS